jgi:DNA-binding transcriptional ArsR family regulator
MEFAIFMQYLQKEAHMPRRRISHIDAKTGEVLDSGVLAYITPKRKNGFGKGWMAMSQEAMKILAQRRKEIGGEGYAVMFSIIGSCGFGNEFKAVNQAQVANETNMHQSNVSRAIKRLVKIGILIEGERKGINKVYRVSPELGWKGEAKGHVIALNEELQRRLERSTA